MNDRDESQAAVVARCLVRYENIGTLATIFHSDPTSPGHHEPGTQEQVTLDMSALEATEQKEFVKEREESQLEGYPFSLFDYYVDLPQYPGVPIFFISKLQKCVKNIKHDPRASFTIQSSPQFMCKFMGTSKSTPMESGRVSLVGKVVPIDQEKEPELVIACRNEFVKIHPDSKKWMGMNDFSFYRFEVDKIYWVGGFGNIHYIGWIHSKLYSGVGEEKLPAPRIGYQPCDTPTGEKFSLSVNQVKQNLKPIALMIIIIVSLVFMFLG
ncbi:hypothetical protein DSO57_1031595 [Entomophthora muscae]|uniref:Uncharacterized protein n=1 Tax=Entomophthora muscae TaxID=34485 RepID=A0ACC2SDD2_9FUNG|nr:hypothetical protein DSO57_1031595 [Entomophthora muscae]